MTASTATTTTGEDTVSTTTKPTPTDEQIAAVYEILPMGTKRLAAEAILMVGDGLAAQALAASLSDEAMLAELIKRGRLKATLTH